MFESLPQAFRKHRLKADVRTLLLLRTSMDKGLVNTLGDLFLVLKGLVTRDPRDFGPFTTAFYDYFLEIEIKKGERLETAIVRSDTFKKWRETIMNTEEWEEEPYVADLVERFLNEVHLTTLDIKKLVSGKDILNKDDPNRPDLFPEENPEIQKTVETAADYRDVSAEELMERLKQIAKQQKGKHTGGNRWIGSGGMSPFGFNGAALGGLRMSGGGGGKMARAVIGDMRFYPVDKKVRLKDDQIDVALATLKGIQEADVEQILDIPKTIKEGLKQGGIFLPYEKEKVTQKVQVMLLIDNGGLSMTPYIKTVTKLFSKMKIRFAHDLKTYYYHNTIYGGAYSDVRRRDFVPISKLTALSKNYSVFVIGDADMAPYELTRDSVIAWQLLKEHFPRMAWLNPLEERFWSISDTLPEIKRVIPMFPLTAEGIEKAVGEMNRKRRFWR